MTLPDRLIDAPTLSPAEFARVAAIAHRDAGLCLSEAKCAMISSRLARRLRATGMPDFSTYICFLEGGDGNAERQMLISALTTNVSHFFREKHHFDMLRDTLIPTLSARAKAGGRVRVWSAGCSTGQEPYSIAMTILSAFPDAARHDVRVLATDIDTEVLAAAERGIYSARQLEGIDPEMRRRFIDEVADDGDSFKVRKEVRALVTYRPLNLIGPWPVHGPFDVIFCRNVVIYFDAATQAELWPRFHRVLAPDGVVFLGHSERLDPASARDFTSIGVTSYRKARSAGAPARSSGGTL
jgi:chemotaxis protein methyltransferase CheR